MFFHLFVFIRQARQQRLHSFLVNDISNVVQGLIMGHREDNQLHYISILPSNKNGYPHQYQRYLIRRSSEQDRSKPVREYMKLIKRIFLLII